MIIAYIFFPITSINTGFFFSGHTLKFIIKSTNIRTGAYNASQDEKVSSGYENICFVIFITDNVISLYVCFQTWAFLC